MVLPVQTVLRNSFELRKTIEKPINLDAKLAKRSNLSRSLFDIVRITVDLFPERLDSQI